jgi:nitrogen fixation NifU-like protein
MDASYSEKLLDHYRNPRNVGSLSPADGSARRENQVCGDVLEIYLKIRDGKIEQARFKAEGCIPTIALASFATEWCIGKSVAESRQVEAAFLAASLEPLPSHKLHAAQLVAETLRAAAGALDSSAQP